MGVKNRFRYSADVVRDAVVEVVGALADDVGDGDDDVDVDGVSSVDAPGGGTVACVVDVAPRDVDVDDVDAAADVDGADFDADAPVAWSVLSPTSVVRNLVGSSCCCKAVHRGNTGYDDRADHFAVRTETTYCHIHCTNHSHDRTAFRNTSGLDLDPDVEET